MEEKSQRTPAQVVSELLGEVASAIEVVSKKVGAKRITEQLMEMLTSEQSELQEECVNDQPLHSCLQGHKASRERESE